MGSRGGEALPPPPTPDKSRVRFLRDEKLLPCRSDIYVNRDDFDIVMY